MDFSPEERSLLLQTARAWFRDHNATRGNSRPVGLPREPDPACMRELAALGLVGLAVPEADGGSGGGVPDLCAVVEAAGENLFVEPLLATLGSGLPLLVQLGTESQRAALLPPVLSGAHGATL